MLPIVEAGNKVRYDIKQGKGAPEGTVERSGAKCICCGTPVEFSYIREEGRAKRLNSQLIAIVTEGKNGRDYFSANDEHVRAAVVDQPLDFPSGKLSGKSRVNVSLYGFDETSDLFTNRQLTALTTFSDLIREVQKKVEAGAITAGWKNDNITLADGGHGATAYGQAISVYMAFVVDRMADRGSSICSWDVSRDGLRNTFGRQAIPMVWDFAEGNPFSNSSGCFDNMLDWVYKSVQNMPALLEGVAKQFDAQSDNGLRTVMVSTDPPYYDNIGYADLSDFFYIWMRKSLKEIYHKLFRTMLVPKVEELVATPYRFDGSVKKARDFFEDGMLKTFKQVFTYARDDVPVTIFYAFKQSESKEDDLNGVQTASTGWETMLSAVIEAGFSITGTWPMRTEMANRSIASGTNALASSIVLVCRKRSEDATVSTRRDFINTLKRELKPALKELQRSNIAPVDLAQSAIGPGMAVFSRYSAVLDADGSPMSIRSALQIINKELDLYFSEQDGDLDGDSRFCVELYSQFAFNTLKFGEADVLARAKNTSVEKLVSRGVLFAQKGDIHLLTREELPERVNASESIIWLLTQQLTRAMETGGIKACAQILKDDYGTNTELAKALAYRLFTIAEGKHWAQEAYAYNSLIIAWPDIQLEAAKLRSIPEQMSLEDIQNREA